MRVAHFMERFSPLSETFIYDYITQLERDGIDNCVLTLSRSNCTERPFEYVHVVELPARWQPTRIWARLARSTLLQKRALQKEHLTPMDWYVPLLQRRLKQLLESLKPDVIHAQFGPSGVLIAPVAAALDIPLVVTFLGYDISRLPHDSMWITRYKRLFESATCVIGISNHICSKLKDVGAPVHKIKLIHLGVHLGQFAYSDPASRFDGKNVYCTHVGRLVEKKSPIDLVKAFKKAVDNAPLGIRLHLRIIGDGPLREETLCKIKEFGLGEYISYMGPVPHEKVMNILQDSHIYTQHCKTASDGDQEGQGVSFVEASAIGLPIVTTRHNGIPDVVINGRTGFLVAEGDTDGMAQKILFLARNPKLWTQFGMEGRARMESEFDLFKQSKKTIDLLDYVSKRRELPSALNPRF